MAKKITTQKPPAKQEGKKSAKKPQSKKPSDKKTVKKETAKKKSKKEEAQALRLKTILAVIFLAIVAVIGLIIIISWPTPTALPTVEPVERITITPPEAVTTPIIIETLPTPEQPLVPPAQQQPKLAILMDDLGINFERGIAAINLNIPISVAIIPGEQHATSLMEFAHKKQREILIHMPMQPVSYPTNDPGPLGLFVTQSDDHIVAATKHLIELLPLATGGNNHMGSEFTRHANKMNLVLTEMAKAQLFFIDSLTISDSIAHQEAKRLGVPTTVRDRFLDNEREVEKISAQLESLVALAKEQGHAIGICHPYPETLISLELFSQQLDSLGIEIVPLAQLAH